MIAFSLAAVPMLPKLSIARVQAVLTHLMHVCPFKLEQVSELHPEVACRDIVVNGRSNGSVILWMRPILFIVWTSRVNLWVKMSC